MKPEKMLERMAAESLRVAGGGEPWEDTSDEVRDRERQAIQAALRELIEMSRDEDGVCLCDVMEHNVLAITELEQ